MKRILQKLVICVIIFLSYACVWAPEKKNITIATNNYQTLELTELVDSVFFIPLENEVLSQWGQIDAIKSYNEHYILHDEFHSMSLLFVDKNDFSLIQFYQEGDGPTQYKDLSLFASLSKDTFVIYDRTYGLKYYEYPTFNLTKSIQISDFYLMGLEKLDENSLFIIKEESSNEESSGGYYISNLELSKQKKLKIPSFNFSIELSYPSTYVYLDDTITFLQAGPINTQYQITAENTNKSYQFYFDENIDDHEIWKSQNYDLIENQIYNKNKSIFPYQMLSASVKSFWFKNGRNQGLDNLVIINPVNNHNLVVKKVIFNEENIIQDIRAIGQDGDFYLTILSTESDYYNALLKKYHVVDSTATDFIMGYRLKNLFD